MHFENDTDLYRVIGANIKQYREQAKLTQVQLAEQAKISISYLSKIEASGCDKSLSISVLNQIANVLGVEISEFFKILDEDKGTFDNLIWWEIEDNKTLTVVYCEE